jgi:hypothetical protein
MDWNKINKIWTDFTSKYNLELKDIDQHLIFVPNKRQTYSTVEIINDFKIYYKYVFYKLDLIDVGNDFRIAIPVETKLDIIISRPNLLIRTFKNKRINYSIDIIKLDNRIENEIIRLFNKFNDLKISLTSIQVNSDSQIENNTNILELTTKQLPQEIEQIEELRELIIKILNELIMKKMIKCQQVTHAHTAYRN